MPKVSLQYYLYSAKYIHVFSLISLHFPLQDAYDTVHVQHLQYCS